MKCPNTAQRIRKFNIISRGARDKKINIIADVGLKIYNSLIFIANNYFIFWKILIFILIIPNNIIW
jgi:hypothetical protein